MNDYKELIECLKIRSEYNRDGGFWNEGVSDSIDAAIKAIEQLVKERDAAIADLKEYASCDYCKHSLTGCENRLEFTTAVIGTCGGEKFEWRGVQK